MDTDAYVAEMKELYLKMRKLASDFSLKKDELDASNKIYLNNMATPKVFVKSEPVIKKPKTSTPAVKKSVFAGTPLETSSKKRPHVDSFSTPDVHVNDVVTGDSGYSSVTSN